MKSRSNPLLSQFVDRVRQSQAEEPLLAAPDGTFSQSKELAIAAADFIEKRLRAASKGGLRATKKKPGRPIKNKSRSAELTRARVRRHRAEKNEAKASGAPREFKDFGEYAQRLEEVHVDDGRLRKERWR